LAKPTQKKPIILATQKRSMVTFESILEATTYFLEREGLGKFTTNDIAHKAGVNINSFYQNFLNRDSAILEVTNRFLKDDETAFALCLNEAKSKVPNEQFLFIVHQMLNLMKTNRSLRRAILVNLTAIVGSQRTQVRRRSFAESLEPFINSQRFKSKAQRLIAAQVIVHTFLSVCVGFLDGVIEGSELTSIEGEIHQLLLRYIG
jgi:AcrR family transcriptional regulator